MSNLSGRHKILFQNLALAVLKGHLKLALFITAEQHSIAIGT
ncbi:hypothetical protein [Paludibacterium denitrificans]|nr:hypothetical protein [Paludibacterium denitrificans]